MDYSGFYEFPFPSELSDDESKVKNFFLSLPDEIQLKLLNGSTSYSFFFSRVLKYMQEYKPSPIPTK